MSTLAIRRAYADSPLGQLHYAECGEGPPLIMLHQTPRSHDEYMELLPELGVAHRAIAMDMYGFGLSAKPQGAHAIEQYAAGAVALADALGIREFSILGHHTGAVVAIEVAAAVPHRVAAVVLSSPAYTGEDYRRRHAGGVPVDGAVPAADGTHLTTLWALRAPYYPEDTRLLDRFIRDALAPGVDPTEGHRACARYVMEHRISLISAPVLVLGASDDPFAMPDIEPVTAGLSGSPSVEVVIIQGGMIPLMEKQAPSVAAAVLAFLRR